MNYLMFPKINYHVLHPVINPMLQQQNLNYSMLHSTVSMHDIPGTYKSITLCFNPFAFLLVNNPKIQQRKIFCFKLQNFPMLLLRIAQQ